MPSTSRPQDKIDPNDGGYASRKFWLSCATMLLLFLGALVAAKYAGMAGVYPELIGGLLAVLATYCGANIGAKVVTGKHALAIGSGDAADEAEDAPLVIPGQPVEELPPGHDED